MARTFTPEVTKLSNGIPVILQHVEGLVASTYWWNKVGSADETPPEAGFAHFLEHMLFKDAAAKETGKASTGKMARAIESLGGELNAYTSFDQTVYHVTCAEQHWEKVLSEWGVIAKPQKFLKQDFESEREVILEELRKNEDSPDRQLFQNLFSSTFAKHPYGRPVIGYARTLKAAKVKNLEAFYQKHYVSSNMGLIVVGPIDDAKGARKKLILRKLEDMFGSRLHRPKDSQKPKRPLESELRARPNLVAVPFAVKSPTLAFSFRVPSLMHPDVPVLDILSGALGMGELSRLHQHLFYKKAIATSAGAGLYVPKDPGMLYVSAEFTKLETAEEITKEFLEVFKRMIADGPTKEELERIVANEEAERLYATQTTDGMAGRLGFLQFVMGDLHFDNTYLAKLRSVSADDVKRVAETYLDPKRSAGALMYPKEHGKVDVKPLATLLESQLKGSLSVPKSKPTNTQGLKIQQGKLESGISWSVLERPHSNAFSIHLSTLGGLRLESPKQAGLSHLMAETWTKGTALKNASDISRIIEGAAADLSGFSGRNSVGLECTGLARDWDRLTELLTEVICEPSFPEEEINHVKRVTEEQLKNIEDHSSQLCSRYFMETLFEQHPYRRLVLGSLETLPSLESKALRDMHRQWIHPARLHVSVVGAVTGEKVRAWLASLEAKMKMFSNQDAMTVETPNVEPDLKSPRWIERKLGREQIHILVGGLGISIFDENRYPLRLLQTLLGGQSGRLFIELREKKSLAYTVAPVSFEGLERGYVGTYIGCAPHKQQEAIAGIKKVLEGLANKGPTENEMKRAKEFFLGRRAMELQSDGSLAAHYGLKSLYGLPFSEDDEIKEKVNAINAKALKRVCDEYLVQPHMVTATVG